MTPSITQSQAFTALRSFILGILPAGAEVIQGQGNRVPAPASDNFVVMTIDRREGMARPVRDYDAVAGTETVGRSTTLRFQLDVYGASAGDNAQVIHTIMNDASGVEMIASAFASLGISGLTPLFCRDPQQMPAVFGEQQYTQRWMIACALHGNITVTRSIEFADDVITTLSEYK